MRAGLPSQSRYYPISSYYRSRFGCRVYKVGVSVALNCPNRGGQGNEQGCIFCDKWGAAAYHETAQLPISEQIRRNGEKIRKRYKAEKFLVYFQAYTSTLKSVGALETLLKEALEAEDVIGLVVGTRPDCLPGKVVDLLAGLADNHYVSVELGLQTLDDTQLKFLSRGHDMACSLAALEMLGGYPDIDVGVHLMFGLPGENDDQLMETAARLSGYDLAGVKLHNLHVLKNTPLAGMFERGEFTPVELPEYARKVGVFLEHLSPRVAVHRLSAVASRWDDLISPAWTKEKMGATQYILDYLERVDSWQGKHYLEG